MLFVEINVLLSGHYEQKISLILFIGLHFMCIVSWTNWNLGADLKIGYDNK